MYYFSNPLILLTLSVALSGIQGRVIQHRSQVCYQDNELRALERFSSYADGFCPALLADKTNRLPPWLKRVNKTKMSSACSCYEKTAKPAATGAPSSALSSPPPALTAVFATSTSSTRSQVPSSSVAGSVAGVGTGTAIPAYTTPLVTAPAVHSASTVATTEKAVSSAPVDSGIPVKPSSTSIIPLEGSSFYTSELPAPTDNGNKYPPQPFGAGSGKRGLMYDYKTQNGWSALFHGSQLATYGSNWDVIRGSALDDSFAYVPTIKVDADLNNNDWNSTVPVLIEGGTKALFG